MDILELVPILGEQLKSIIMPKISRKKTVNPSDKAGTRKFFTVAGIVTVALLALLYLIYSMS